MTDNIKSDLDVEFQRWYHEATQLASYIGTEEEMPSVLMVQCNMLTHRFFITRAQ